MGNKHSGSNLQGEWQYLELLLLYIHEASAARNEGGGKGDRKRLCRIITVNEIQCGIMPGSGTIDAVFILRRLQEENHAKGK